MGRETRQARRARQRREAERGQPGKSTNWTIIGGAAVIVAAIAVFAVMVFVNNNKGSNSPTAALANAHGKPIDGIQCDAGMSVGFHVHAHVSIFNAGKPYTIPAQVGFDYNNDCLYWLHTHNTDGVVHEEAPHAISPTLGQFFDIWHQPLSTTRIGGLTVKPGEQLKMWVNNKPYTGDPRQIPLARHNSITIEVGPPWVTPTKFGFPGGL